MFTTLPSTALRAGRMSKDHHGTHFIAGECKTVWPLGKEILKKLKHRLVIRPSNSIPTCITKKPENKCPDKNFYTNIQSRITHNSFTHNGNNPNVYQLVNG